MKITIEIDGEVGELADERIVEEFTWHNMRDSNHCRRVRRKIFEAILALARVPEDTRGKQETAS